MLQIAKQLIKIYPWPRQLIERTNFRFHHPSPHDLCHQQHHHHRHHNDNHCIWSEQLIFSVVQLAVLQQKIKMEQKGKLILKNK